MSNIFLFRRAELHLTPSTLDTVEFFEAFGGEKDILMVVSYKHWISWAGRESHLVYSLTEK